MKTEILKIEISLAIIPAEYKEQLQDLNDEILRTVEEKESLISQIESRLAEIDKALQKRCNEEDEILKQAKILHEKEDYEGALKALEKVLYHKLQEKFLMVNSVSLNYIANI